MAGNANWYVVHTYSGYENTVKATIEKYVENRNMHELIHEISIPLETVTEITDNGPKDLSSAPGITGLGGSLPGALRLMNPRAESLGSRKSPPPQTRNCVRRGDDYE